MLECDALFSLEMHACLTSLLFGLESCSPVFLSCCGLANQLLAYLLLLGTENSGHPQLSDAAQPLNMGLPTSQQGGPLPEELCQVAATFIFAGCTLIFTCITALGGFLHFWLYSYAASQLQLWLCWGYSHFIQLWSSGFVGAEHFWRKLSEEGKKHSNMSKNRLGLLMYLVPCFQTAACWEPHPSVFCFFFLQKYVLSTIWFA